MKSIWFSTRTNPYTICLVDDGSPNKGFVNDFRKAPRTKVAQLDKQQGFGAALAAGFNETESQFVVFLHSDILIEDGNWLLELLRSYFLLRTHKVALVAARTNNPGDYTDPRLKAEKGQKGQDDILDEGHLPLYCAVCERRLFEHIKGFIKPYPYGWYEDEELAHRIRKNGLKLGISGGSWVHHEGSLTFNNLIRKYPEIENVLDENRNRCIADIRGLSQKT